MAELAQGNGCDDPSVRRRFDDDPVRSDLYTITPVDAADPSAEYGKLAGARFLLRVSADDVLVMHAEDAHLLRAGEDAGDLERRVTAAAPAWRHERARRERRARMAAWLMVYVDALDAAQTSAEAVAAVRSCAPLVAGGLEALVCDLDDPHMTEGPVVVTPGETGWRPDGSRTALATLFQQTRAAQFLCTRLTDRLLLVLVERRSDRVFTGEDRDLMTWIVMRVRRTLLRLECRP